MREGINLTIEDRVARLTLNNPAKHNSLNLEGIEQFFAHLESIKNNPGLRVLVVTGAGDRTFCSGASLSQIQAGVVTPELFESLADHLAALAIPKIAAINGNAFGGGVEIGLCCDFRVGVAGMRAMVPAARFGLCYPVRGIQRFVHGLGSGPAKRILARAESMDAPTLLQLGYLHRIVEPEALSDMVDRWADEIAALAPLAVSTMLKICDQSAAGILDNRRAQEWVDQCKASDDLQEGLQAVIDKRQPEFNGS
jgi:enoyl-CoA hydratase/carnithine racemase